MAQGYSEEAFKLMRERDISYAFACEILENEARQKASQQTQSDNSDIKSQRYNN